jgi:signal transduction histidine kinase
MSLGLVTADKIVSDHSGKMDIQSTGGRGTVVTVQLPKINEGGS